MEVTDAGSGAVGVHGYPSVGGSRLGQGRGRGCPLPSYRPMAEAIECRSATCIGRGHARAPARETRAVEKAGLDRPVASVALVANSGAHGWSGTGEVRSAGTSEPSLRRHGHCNDRGRAADAAGVAAFVRQPRSRVRFSWAGVAAAPSPLEAPADADFEIPSYVYDVHTPQGKRSGKTKQDFLVEEHEALADSSTIFRKLRGDGRVRELRAAGTRLRARLSVIGKLSAGSRAAPGQPFARQGARPRQGGSITACRCHACHRALPDARPQRWERL
jgi:hypothetical protein